MSQSLGSARLVAFASSLVMAGFSASIASQEQPASREQPLREVRADAPMGPATVYSSGPLSTAIPDANSTGLTQLLSVPIEGVVVDVNVRVRITHSRLSDLTLYLKSPDGTRIKLADKVGIGGADFGAGSADCSGDFLNLDDEGTTSILASSAPYLGVHRPQGALAHLKGQAASGAWGLIVVDEAQSALGTLNCWQLVLRRTSLIGDLRGNSRSDPAVWRPAALSVYAKEIERATQPVTSIDQAQASDLFVPGDFDGNGRDDAGAFRPSTGEWRASSFAGAIVWGGSGDVPVAGDYDANGTTDIAIWRPSTGMWYVREQFSAAWGGFGDIPVPGDYNGDGTTDMAVWRPSTGTWFIYGITSLVLGQSGDIPVPADYDGDSRTDFAVWRPTTGQWFVHTASGHQLPMQTWGGYGDIPVPADYDGDLKADLAIWRPSDVTYYIRNVGSRPWGEAGDVPVQKRPTYPGYPY
jgi:subtilisin-like proprotein convertase family protein